MERSDNVASARAAIARAFDAEEDEEVAMKNRLTSLIALDENDATRCRARDKGGCSVWRVIEGATPNPAARRRWPPGRMEAMLRKGERSGRTEREKGRESAGGERESS